MRKKAGRGKSRLPGNAEAGEVEYGVRLDVSLEALSVHGCETFFFQLPQLGVAALSIYVQRWYVEVLWHVKLPELCTSDKSSDKLSIY